MAGLSPRSTPGSGCRAMTVTATAADAIKARRLGSCSRFNTMRSKQGQGLSDAQGNVRIAFMY